MMSKEMKKLREGLTAAGIEWRDDSFASPFGWVGIVRTKFTNKNGEKCSVICGESTYGGQAGLLETMPPVHLDPEDEWQDEVEGWLTAEEILAEWV